jgi:hypothetical protein
MGSEHVEVAAWQRGEQLVIQRAGSKCVQLRLSGPIGRAFPQGGMDARSEARSAGMADTRIGAKPLSVRYPSLNRRSPARPQVPCSVGSFGAPVLISFRPMLYLSGLRLIHPGYLASGICHPG